MTTSASAKLKQSTAKIKKKDAARRGTERPRPVHMVGRKIRQLRKERQLTQTELSSRIGIQQSDLSRMEKGEYRVSLDNLFKILAEFRMSIGEFFDEVTTESISPRDVQLVRRFKELDDTSQREVEDFIDFKRSQQPGRD